jgi:protein-S-isoprenylcysteine O-methyltransferase Ste14
MTLAIITNVGFSVILAGLNILLSIKIFRELVAKINQKSGGEVITTLTYIFLTKFLLLAIAIIASGASPFTIFCLVALNFAEYTFANKNAKLKRFVK